MHRLGQSDILSSRPTFPPEKTLLLQGRNALGDSGLVLSTDAKPRLKWTPELHERFIEAVNQLGGADKATPKTVMRIMGIPGLTLYHLKSHLQKYRLSKNLQVQTNCGGVMIGSAALLDRRTEASGSTESQPEVASQTNKSMKISESLMIQVEVQRQLNEQLEVQRQLQLRIEAQGKYLQSVLEKTEETLGKQNFTSMGPEDAKFQLSEHVSNAFNKCLPTEFPGFKETAHLPRQHAHTTHVYDGSTGSCLTSNEDIGKDDVGMFFRTYHSDLFVQNNKSCDIAMFEETPTARCGEVNHKELVHSSLPSEVDAIFMIEGGSALFSLNTTHGLNENNSIADASRKETEIEYPYLGIQNSKTLEILQGIEKQSSQFGFSSRITQLDLNINDNNEDLEGCKQFDLNGFN
ncbi:myb-related protein 2 [Dendrobium catenatum]|uniref:myb-related protein 2 n=1 Tax=Dendrobium catenatum TaxID=906689 RepID=UPI0009F6D8E0|nr:myb-related protein 2 [Dendrobium catenatum]XP_028552894.1 myb-related protein 2 [Dendrobium catenatum]